MEDRSAIFDNLTGGTVLVEDLNSDRPVSIEELKRILGLTSDNTIGRYQDITTIGLGGIGTVFSAREPVLNREIALKILRPAYRNNTKFIDGFIREARATAQIDHPNIVPVHQLGVFDDVGAYFTMKRVIGQTLRLVLKKIDAGDREYQRKYSLYRLLEIFLSACNGVAFAHSKGIIHRDLKPANIMLGDYGEVFVMDWGLVKYQAENDSSEAGKKISLDTELSENNETDDPDATATHKGSISGTPAYMAPEQVAGLSDEIDSQTDIYSLGAILYSILTGKPTPFPDNAEINQVLQQAVNGDFLPPRRRAPRRKIPRELEAICLKAMARVKSDRYPTVQALIGDVRNFMDNYPVSAYSPPPFYRFTKLVRRHPVVPLALIIAFFTALGVFTALRYEQIAQFESRLIPANHNIFYGNIAYERALNTYSQLQQKLKSDDISEEQFLQLAEQLKVQQTEFENFYESALELLSQLEMAGYDSAGVTSSIVEIYSRRLNYYTLTDNLAMVRQLADRLRKRSLDAYNTIIAADQAQAGPLRDIIAEECQVSINTSVPESLIFYQQLIPDQPLEAATQLGTTPLQTVLPEGSYLFLVQLPGKSVIKYPASLRSSKPVELNIEIPANIPNNTVYIPAGPFSFGNVSNLLPNNGNATLPGYFIGRYEVTFAEYLEFWRRQAPKDQAKYMAKFPDADRQYTDAWNAGGELRSPFAPNMPVTGITGEAAEAYCRWRTKTTGLRYRLPTPQEWEKAARGVDGRTYIWGEQFQPEAALTAVHKSSGQFPFGAPVNAFPQDRSIYGVADMCGNVREFVRKPNHGGLYVVKGASFKTDAGFARCAASTHTGDSETDIGFRYVIELPENNK